MNQPEKEIPKEQSPSSTKSILKPSGQSKLYSVYTSKILLFIGLAVLTVAISFLIWNATGSIHQNSKFDFVLLNNFGAFVGGIVGSLWALAGVILFYIALQDQKKYIETNQEAFDKQVEALNFQIDEFKLQKEELRLTREVFTEQSKTQKLQRFETTFFNSLKLIIDQRKSIQIEIPFTEEEIFYPAHPYAKKDINKMNGIKAVKGLLWVLNGYFIEEKLLVNEMNIENNEETLNAEILLSKAYKKYYDRYSNDLEHYFRVLFTVYNLIKNEENIMHEYYTKMFIAQLSVVEILQLFYFSVYFERLDMVQALNQHSAFNNIRPTKFIIDWQLPHI